jgi:hypothetical protein
MGVTILEVDSFDRKKIGLEGGNVSGVVVATPKGVNGETIRKCGFANGAPPHGNANNEMVSTVRSTKRLPLEAPESRRRDACDIRTPRPTRGPLRSSESRRASHTYRGHTRDICVGLFL